MIGFRTTVAALGMMIAAAAAQAQTIYKVGSTPTGTPFTFLDAKSNTIQGMMVDVIEEIGKDAGFKVEIQPMQFSTLIAALTSGKIDIISAAMARAIGHDLRCGQLAIAALAPPHPGTPERLDAIDLAATEFDGLAQFAGRHAFAAADYRLIRQSGRSLGRPGKGLRDTAREAVEPGQAAPLRRNVRGRQAEILQAGHSGKPTRDLRPIGPDYPEPVSGEIDAASRPPHGIGLRQPLPPGFVIGEVASGQIRKAGLGPQMPAKTDRIARRALAPTRFIPPEHGDRPPPIRLDPIQPGAGMPSSRARKAPSIGPPPPNGISVKSLRSTPAREDSFSTSTNISETAMSRMACAVSSRGRPSFSARRPTAVRARPASIFNWP